MSFHRFVTSALTGRNPLRRARHRDNSAARLALVGTVLGMAPYLVIAGPALLSHAGATL